MLSLSLPWWEFIVRGIVVYFFLLILLRLGGRKQVGQLSSFDFVLLLIISNAVQNSMNGGDNSITGGLIIATALIATNWFINFINSKYKKVSRLIEGEPTVFIHNGKLKEEILKNENISHEELMSILRKNDVLKIEEIRFAVLEANGEISIIKKTSN